MSIPVSEPFTGAAASLPNPPWTNTETGPVSLSGTGTGDIGGAGDNIAIWNADSFPADQVATVTNTITLAGTGVTYVGLVVRSDAAAEASCNCYQFFTDGGSDTELVKIVAGTLTVLGTDNAMPANAGDVLSLSIVGSLLTASRNGTPVITVTDASIASGQPGLVLNSSFGIGFLAVDDWSADSVPTGGGGGGGSPHTVTGRGNVAVVSPNWLSIALSGVFPPVTSTGQAEPANYFHVGMISWGTAANGAMKAYPVTRLSDLVEVPAGMDTLWYEFQVGVTAVITELASP